MQIYKASTLLLLAMFNSGVCPLAKEPDMSPLIVAVTAQGSEMSSQVSARFGQSNYFMIVDVNSDRARTIVKRDSRHTGSDLAQEMINFKVEVVITGQIGPNALDVLRAAEITVIQGVSGSVEGAIRRFESGEIR